MNSKTNPQFKRRIKPHPQAPPRRADHGFQGTRAHSHTRRRRRRCTHSTSTYNTRTHGVRQAQMHRAQTPILACHLCCRGGLTNSLPIPATELHFQPTSTHTLPSAPSHAPSHAHPHAHTHTTRARAHTYAHTHTHTHTHTRAHTYAHEDAHNDTTSACIAARTQPARTTREAR